MLLVLLLRGKYIYIIEKSQRKNQSIHNLAAIYGQIKYLRNSAITRHAVCSLKATAFYRGLKSACSSKQRNKNKNILAIFSCFKPYGTAINVLLFVHQPCITNKYFISLQDKMQSAATVIRELRHLRFELCNLLEFLWK